MAVRLYAPYRYPISFAPAVASPLDFEHGGDASEASPRWVDRTRAVRAISLPPSSESRESAVLEGVSRENARACLSSFLGFHTKECVDIYISLKQRCIFSSSAGKRADVGSGHGPVRLGTDVLGELDPECAFTSLAHTSTWRSEMEPRERESARGLELVSRSVALGRDSHSSGKSATRSKLACRTGRSAGSRSPTHGSGRSLSPPRRLGYIYIYISICLIGVS